MLGVALLYMLAMVYAVWWFAGVRAHRHDQRPSVALVVPRFSARFPGAGLTWTPDDDQRVADFLDHPQDR